MNIFEIIDKLVEIRDHYDEGWTWHDLQCDLEEIFEALDPEREV